MKLEEYKRASYCNQNNYKIVKYNANSKLCYIFCSSNGIYSGKTEEEQVDFIISDRYEWESISASKVFRRTSGKCIYLRDVYRHFYVDGINKHVNSIYKIISFLAEETKGYDVYVAGYSSGGYLAMIIGCFLPNVKRVYSWSGLFSLYNWKGANSDYDFSEIDYLVCYLDNDKSYYYDINNFIKKNNIYHFYSSLNKADMLQYDSLIDDVKGSINIFGFKTKNHESNMLHIDHIKILTCSDNHLRKIVEKFNCKQNINKYVFSIYNLGLFGFFFVIIKKSIIKMIRIFCLLNK